MNIVLSEFGTARIESWIGTNDVDGARIVVSCSSGMDFHVLSILASNSGYPITIKIHQDEFYISSRDEFEQELVKVLKHPNVISIIQYALVDVKEDKDAISEQANFEYKRTW